MSEKLELIETHKLQISLGQQHPKYHLVNFVYSISALEGRLSLTRFQTRHIRFRRWLDPDPTTTLITPSSLDGVATLSLHLMRSRLGAI